MAKKKAIAFDPVEFLNDAESQRELLEDAFSTGERAYIADAIGLVARARGMSQMARDTGVTREGLYKALSKDGDPRLSTLLSVMKALGIKLAVTPN